MSALLCVWLGVPLLAGVAPYVARLLGACLTAWRTMQEALSVAASANAWPMAWRASVRIAEAYASCVTIASDASALLCDPNVMIRLRYYALARGIE